jgi:hypothetical protein
MQRDLENLSTRDLRELLICKSTELLDASQDRHGHGAQIHSLQVEVKEIQEALKVKRENISLAFVKRDNFSLALKINFLI